MSVNVFKKNNDQIDGKVIASFQQLSIGSNMNIKPQTLTREFLFKGIVKRIFDIIFGLGIFIVVLPLFIVISLLIKIDSPGPVFFRQRRVGLNGDFFNIWKFRTMHKANSESDHKKYIVNLFKEQVDEAKVNVDTDQVEKYMDYLNVRMTKAGRFLRATSLDELPQILNILAGNMSFVGPRPHPVYEVQEYKHWYMRRLNVKPGLAGWSKLKLRLTPKNYEEAILYDLWYVDNWSTLLDSKILVLTVPHVLFQKGAY